MSRLDFPGRLLGLLTYFGEADKAKLYSPEWRRSLAGHHSRERLASQLAAPP